MSWLPVVAALLAGLLLCLGLLWALMPQAAGGGGGSAGPRGDGARGAAAVRGGGSGLMGDDAGPDISGSGEEGDSPSGETTKPAEEPGTTPSTAPTPEDTPTVIEEERLSFDVRLARPVTMPASDPGVSGSSGSATRGGPAGPGQGQEELGGDGTIFDRQGRGTKFIYVIDFSSSMSAGITTTRFDAARTELIESIKRLNEHMEFYVIFYNDHKEPMPERGLVRATEENKERAIDWIRSMGTRGGTNPVPAMETALSLGAHTIFLLSDGEFEPSVRNRIKRANAGKGVSICTIAFHDPSGEQVLRRIAEENNGDYRFVPPPTGEPAWPRSRRQRLPPGRRP